MAQQKYRPSKQRSRTRRAQYLKSDPPPMSVCPNCGAKKLPHRVCPDCGFYKGRKVVFEKVKTKKKEEK